MATIDQTTNLYNSNDSGQSQIVSNKHEKYFLGDRKTFMQELQDNLEKISLDMLDPDTDSMIIEGELIDDKNSPGAMFYINTKLNELKDLNRTIISTFDFLKEIEKEVSRLIT